MVLGGVNTTRNPHHNHNVNTDPHIYLTGKAGTLTPIGLNIFISITDSDYVI